MREALARSDRDFAQAPRRARARAIEIEEIEEGESMGTGSPPSCGPTRSKSPLPCCWPPRPAPSSGTLSCSRRAGIPPPSLPAEGPISGPAAAVAARAGPGQSSGSSSDSPSIGRGPFAGPGACPCAAAAPRAIFIGDLIRSGDLPPLPVARPASAPSPRLAPVVITPPPQQDPHPQPARSAIGDLIRLGDMPPIPPALVAKVEPSRLVTSGQRALAKLGYGPMKADGVLGPSTRQAIERFERDRRLTVTGDFAPRTARELPAASGLPVE